MRQFKSYELMDNKHIDNNILIPKDIHFMESKYYSLQFETIEQILSNYIPSVLIDIICIYSVRYCEICLRVGITIIDSIKNICKSCNTLYQSYPFRDSKCDICDALLSGDETFPSPAFYYHDTKCIIKRCSVCFLLLVMSKDALINIPLSCNICKINNKSLYLYLKDRTLFIECEKCNPSIIKMIRVNDIDSEIDMTEKLFK
jgi:hypothetical protein